MLNAVTNELNAKAKLYDSIHTPGIKSLVQIHTYIKSLIVGKLLTYFVSYL